ncbi:hypothetical protein Tco_0255753 [Tanacetum coccineum]
MGELTFFLGLQVKQKKDGIFISQDKYVEEILKKFGFIKVKTASTPMETQKPLLKDEDGKEVDVHMYRSMIGSLMYLTSSRPYIMFAVCACARYQVNLKVSHLHDVKRIFRYLKGQSKLVLWYTKDSPFDLVVYTNSDYARASLDRKSTTGGCEFLGCRLISWQCKKQTVVANSTTEAEYVAASSCYGQVLWIQNQLLDYGYNFMHTKIFIDNNSTICIIKNPVFHSKTKHIEIRQHFIRDCNEKKWIEMVKIHTNKNVADLLTKDFDAKTIDGEEQLHALVDGKKIIITESTVRRDLQLDDEEDEVVHKEWGDSLVRATTNASSLEVECQETMGDTIAQTRFENVSKHSNDSLLVRGNTLRSDEDRLKLNELMTLCTNLQHKVLALEKTKTSQQKEIASLKRRVKKLEKKNSLGKDVSKQERIDAIDADEEITLVSVQNVDEEMFDVNVLDGEEVFVAEQEVAANKENDEVNVVEEVVEVINTAKLIVDDAQVSAAGNVVSTAGAATTVSAATTTTDDDGDITLAQALIEMKKKEANIALIETWDDIQPNIDADHKLAERLQAQEQEEFLLKKGTVFQTTLSEYV